MKEPRECIKCQRWFYDSIFYPEGRHGTRWHDCDRIEQLPAPKADARSQSPGGRFKERLAGQA